MSGKITDNITMQQGVHAKNRSVLLQVGGTGADYIYSLGVASILK